MGALHEDQYTFFIISLSVLLIMRNVSDKSCGGNQNTHFMFSTLFLENCAVYEIMWENIDVACGNTSSMNGLHTVTVHGV